MALNALIVSLFIIFHCIFFSCAFAYVRADIYSDGERERERGKRKAFLTQYEIFVNWKQLRAFKLYKWKRIFLLHFRYFYSHLDARSSMMLICREGNQSQVHWVMVFSMELRKKVDKEVWWSEFRGFFITMDFYWRGHLRFFWVSKMI